MFRVPESEVRQTIKNDLTVFKSEIYQKIDELMDEVRKPILSDVGWARLTIGAIVYTIIIVMYIGNGNSMAQSNKENDLKIEQKHKEDVERIEGKQDKIIEILLGIKEDIGENKANK